MAESITPRTSPTILNRDTALNPAGAEKLPDPTANHTAQSAVLSHKTQQATQAVITENAESTATSAELLPTEMPALRSPASSSLTGSGKLLLLMAQLRDMNSDIATQQLADRLAIYIGQSEARAQQAQALSADLDALNQEYNASLEALNSAQIEQNVASEALHEAENALNEAKSNLEKLQQTLPADDPQVLAAQKAVEEAQKQVDSKRSALEQANRNVDAKFAASQQILSNINRQTALMNTTYSTIPSGQMNGQRTAAEQSQQALSSTAVMVKLLAMFIEKVGENASEQLKNDLELNKKQAAARQEEMQRKSDEYEEEVRKSEEAQKMAGCIGNILGGLAIALGAISTIFGGAGVGLMAVGIGLMVADPIMKAATGESLTGMILNPLLEHVLMPMMNAIDGLVAQVFDRTPLGLLLKALDNATGANMMGTIHAIATAAVAIAAIVAVAMIAKSAVNFMLDKLSQALTSALVQTIKAAILDSIKKMVPEMVEKGLQQGSAAVNKAVQEILEQITQKAAGTASRVAKQFDNVSSTVKESMMKGLKIDSPEDMNRLMYATFNRVNMTQDVVQLTNAGVRGGMSVNIAHLETEAAKALAEFKLAQADTKIIQQSLDRAMEVFRQEQELQQSLITSMTETLRNKQSTGHQILRNMHA